MPWDVAPGRPLEAEKLQYMREYTPENQVTNCVQTHPEPRKACIRMPWDVLKQKRPDRTYTSEVRSIAARRSIAKKEES